VKTNVFLDKKEENTTTTTTQIKHKNPCRRRESTWDLLHQSGCVTSAPRSQIRVTIVIKLFNCFDAMGRNVNKQSRIGGPHIFNKFIFFCRIISCMDNHIWQFFIFAEVCFTAYIWLKCKM